MTLDREMSEPKPEPILAQGEAAAQDAVATTSTEIVDGRQDRQRHMHREPSVQNRPPSVALALVLRLARTPGTSACSPVLA
jgi:hypothetical protein